MAESEWRINASTSNEHLRQIVARELGREAGKVKSAIEKIGEAIGAPAEAVGKRVTVNLPPRQPTDGDLASFERIIADTTRKRQAAELVARGDVRELRIVLSSLLAFFTQGHRFPDTVVVKGIPADCECVAVAVDGTDLVMWLAHTSFRGTPRARMEVDFRPLDEVTLNDLARLTDGTVDE